MKMKLKIITLFAILFSFESYACTCGYGSVSSRINGFENIFTAQVIQVLEYHENSTRPKKIKVQVLENFNKQITTNIVWIAKSDLGCPVPNPKVNSKWLFYVSSSDGLLSISTCNPSVSFPKKGATDEVNKIRILKRIKEENKEEFISNTAYEVNSSYFESDFSKSKRYTFDNDYGLYILVFDEADLIVKSVEIVNSLGVTLDESIFEYYKNKFHIKNYSRLKRSVQNENWKLPVLVWKTKL